MDGQYFCYRLKFQNDTIVYDNVQAQICIQFYTSILDFYRHLVIDLKSLQLEFIGESFFVDTLQKTRTKF